MNGRTNTRVIARTETRATLRPVVAEDYFTFHPASSSKRRPALQRPRVPVPLHLSNKAPSPLAAGPAGWRYTPLSSRTSEFESFRYDHGIRFKQRLSVREVLLNFRWHLLLDEDALLSRVKYSCQTYLKAIYKSSKEGMARRGRLLRRFWDWLWRKLVFWRPELDELDDDATYDYWVDVGAGPIYDTEDVQSILGHAV